MAVLIYIANEEGKLKKHEQELLSYGAAVAGLYNTVAYALVFCSVELDAQAFGACGIEKIFQYPLPESESIASREMIRVIVSRIQACEATILITDNSGTHTSIAAGVATRLQAAFVSSVIGLPENTAGCLVKKSVFSGKAFAHIEMNSPLKVWTLQPNTFQTELQPKTAQVEICHETYAPSRIRRIALEKPQGTIALKDASRVVSGGRGMKGPENWTLLEDLAAAMGAALACSRPVADEHWRPHHEHVGQTGGNIAPDLYVAVGISGAIQHLAGVNRSKVIVVINKDPEAPFFKAADYGIVGDALEILPKLTAAVQQLHR